MKLDIRSPAFSFLVVCHVRFEAPLPSGTPCELHYDGSPEGLDHDVRAYVIGRDMGPMGEDGAVMLGFLNPEAHRYTLKGGNSIQLRRGSQVIAVGEVVALGARR